MPENQDALPAKAARDKRTRNNWHKPLPLWLCVHRQQETISLRSVTSHHTARHSCTGGAPSVDAQHHAPTILPSPRDQREQWQKPIP